MAPRFVVWEVTGLLGAQFFSDDTRSDCRWLKKELERKEEGRKKKKDVYR